MKASSGHITANLDKIRERIERAATRCGRRVDAVTLVAVSKTQPADGIRELYEAGVTHFAESRVQEWEAKRVSLKDVSATWHMIGHLQSNKAARAVRLFNRVDSLDSAALAERLDRAAEQHSAEPGESSQAGSLSGERVRLPVLIEVKLDAGGTKSGVEAGELSALAEAVLKMPNLELRGLMGVPPFFDEIEESRPFFCRLRELRDEVEAQVGCGSLPGLSMGMSHDFEVAIEEGATEIRVGTALFGERPKA